MVTTLLKSILHNIGVLAVGLGIAFVATLLDSLFGFPELTFPFRNAVAWLLLMSGFLVRLWATYYFYEQRMKVIVLHPQQKLITGGPYRFSRNPLYLGGNVFIFFGADLLLGTLTGIIITLLGIVATDHFIKREEKQLEQAFGLEWIEYKKRVRRWI